MDGLLDRSRNGLSCVAYDLRDNLSRRDGRQDAARGDDNGGANEEAVGRVCRRESGARGGIGVGGDRGQRDWGLRSARVGEARRSGGVYSNWCFDARRKVLI